VKSIPVCIQVDGDYNMLCGDDCPFKRSKTHFPRDCRECSLFDIGLKRSKPDYPGGPTRHFRCDECNATFQ
jgi:hypothetical protein